MSEPASIGAARAEGGGSSRFFTGVLVLATVALSVLCLMLVRENRRMKGELAALASELAAMRTPADAIREGETLGGLMLVRRDGTVRDLGFGADGGGGPALVFIIGAGCGYCDDVIPVWDRVLTEMAMVGEDGGGWVRLAAVQTDASEPSGLKEMPASIPVFAAREPRSTWLTRVHVEPSAVLLDRRGVVLRAWMGLPDAADAESLRGALLEAATAGEGRGGS